MSYAGDIAEIFLFPYSYVGLGDSGKINIKVLVDTMIVLIAIVNTCKYTEYE